MGGQSHALAEPSVEERVEMAATTAAYECPECYFAVRELKAAPGAPWPHRARWEAKDEHPCGTCGRRTSWCSSGPWEQGERGKGDA